MPATFWQRAWPWVFIVRGHGPLLQALTADSKAGSAKPDT